MSQLSDQLITSWQTLFKQIKSLAFLILLYNLASSANKNILLKSLQTKDKSFINITNNSGPNTLPCGIPLSTGLEPEIAPFILTYCDLENKNALIQLMRTSFK